MHPIVAAVFDVRAVLKGVADANPTFLGVADKAVALTELVRAEGQLAELRLRILADAGDLAQSTAARDAAGWLAQHTRTRFPDAGADLALAMALDRDRPVLAAAMREGRATLAQAHVIHRALTALPTAGPIEVDADTVAAAEAHLVARADEFGPTELSRIGRRILDVVAPEIADRAEAARLAALEAHAADRTRLTMRRLGDGTTRISSLVPDHAATRFATYLHAYTNPRRQTRDQAGDPVTRPAHPKRMGQAFVQLLETVDPNRLPIHGGDATTLIVTIPLASLQADLATADLLGAGLVPATTSPATGSPPDRLDVWPAPRGSCPPSSAAPACPSTSAAPAACSVPPSTRHCSCATARVVPRAATSPARGARPTTATPGTTADPPTSTWASSSAPTTTTEPTTPATAPTASPTATSASTDADRSGAIPAQRGLPIRSPACATT